VLLGLHTILEYLEGVEHLLSNKGKTFTQNDIVLKGIHIASVSYAYGAIDELKYYITLGLCASDRNSTFWGAQAPLRIQLNAATRII